MATKLTIELDATAFRNELKRVIAETKQAGSKIENSFSPSDVKIKITETGAADVKQKIDKIPEKKDAVVNIKLNGKEEAVHFTKELNQGLSNTGKAVTDIGAKTSIFTKMKNLFPQGFTEQVSKGASVISAIGSAAGLSIPPVGGLAVAINILLSPITLIMAALTALVSIGTAVWDKMTVSAEEYAASAEENSKIAQANLEKVRELDQATGKYIERLHELNSAEVKGNAAKIETASILKVLEKEYGSLGAEIDSASGKIKNLDDVMRKLERERNAKKADSLAENEDASVEKARSAYMKARGADYFTTESGARNEFNRMLFDDAGGDLEKMQEAVRIRLDDSQNNAEQRSGYGEVLDNLRKAADFQKKKKNLESTGAETDEEYLASAQKFSQSQQELQAQKKEAKTHSEEREYGKLTDFDKQIQNREEKLKELEKKSADITSKVNASKLRENGNLNEAQKLNAQRETVELQKKEAEAAREVQSVREQIEDLQRKRNKEAADLVNSAKFELEYQTLLEKGEYDRAAALKLEYDLKQKNLKLTDDEKKALESIREKQRAMAGNELTKSSQYEVDYQTLIAKGEYDKAAALKLEHDLKQKNLKLTDDERKALESVLQKQKAVSLAQTLSDKANSMAGRLAEQTGNGKAYAQQTALEDAAKRKGGSLSADEASLTKRLAAMEYDLSHGGRQAWDNVSGTEIVTNSLTARGGFASGAVVPDTEKVNKAIASDTKTIAAKLGELNTLQQEIKK